MRTEVEREVLGDGGRGMPCGGAGIIEKSRGPLTIRKQRCHTATLGMELKRSTRNRLPRPGSDALSIERKTIITLHWSDSKTRPKGEIIKRRLEKS